MTDATAICIVSSGSLSTGPRVVKEADALAAAGHRVHVVVCHWMPHHAAWDARLAAGKPWTWSALRRLPAARALSPMLAAGALAQRAASRLWRAVGPFAPLDELAVSDLTVPLALHAARSVAALRPALVIGHNLAALPVAAWLARRCAARLGFDAEDDHFGELSPPEQGGPLGRLRDGLLARYLPRCDYVTASATGIGDALSERYGIVRPTVVHNVFPWALRRRLDGRRHDRVGPGPSLVWYSQTLGLDRGIQDAIRALARLPPAAALHLRGAADPRAVEGLHALAREVGVLARVHLHPPVHPDDLLSRIAEHDVGLALEHPVNANRIHSVSNKLFFYLLAGLALAASETEGQTRILRALPGVGVSYRPGDHEGLARALASLVGDAARLAAAKQAALAAVESRWCWEREQSELLAVVERTLRTAH